MNIQRLRDLPPFPPLMTLDLQDIKGSGMRWLQEVDQRLYEVKQILLDEGVTADNIMISFDDRDFTDECFYFRGNGRDITKEVVQAIGIPPEAIHAVVRMVIRQKGKTLLSKLKVIEVY